MVVNQKEKKDIKSKNNKKQTQSKESKTLRLIKERKRKAQLRTNPALSIYESGRERTKRVVKKEYPLVNINKLPQILNKGNDNIGVVWKNTNKIQTHTLFNSSNLPCREPASKSDVFYYIAPYKEPKSVNIMEEFNKCKLNFAKENQNRYTDIKAKIEKTKSLKSITNAKVCQTDKKYDQKSNIPTSFLNNNEVSNAQPNQKGFVDIIDKTYEESLKNNIIPLISTISTNPLTKGRIMSEMGLDNIPKANDSLHKVKKSINKNKTSLLKTSENLLMNKNIFNDNFGSIINSIQPLDSIISAKPVSVNNTSLISKQGMSLPNLDFLDDTLDLNKVKMEEELLLNNQSMNVTKDDELLSLLNMNKNVMNPKLGNDLLNDSLFLPQQPFIGSECNFGGGAVPTRPLFPVQKRRSGTLGDILAPFKVSSSPPKVKPEETKFSKNGFSTFNCFNFDEMELPKIELPQNIKKNDDGSFNHGLENSNMFGNDLLYDPSFVVKKEMIAPTPNKMYQEKKYSSGGLGEIAKFSTNVPSTKLKPVKMEVDKKQNCIIDGLDMNKVKQENDSMALDNQIFSSVSIDTVDPALVSMNDALLNNLLTNESLLGMNPSLVQSPSTSVLPNNDVVNQNMAIECFNTELNFIESPYTLPNTLDYANTLLDNGVNKTQQQTNLSKESLVPSPEAKMMKGFSFNALKNNFNEFDIDTISYNDVKSKNGIKEPIQNCCANSIPLATTTSANVRAIPDWYNRSNIDLVDTCAITEEIHNSPQLIKPLVPAVDANTAEKMLNGTFVAEPILPDFSKEILNDNAQYFFSFFPSEIPLPPFTETNVKTTPESKTKTNQKLSSSSSSSPSSSSSCEAPLEGKAANEELSETVINEIIDRLASDDKLKEKTSNSCFAGQNIQETGKMLKKMSEEIDKLVNNAEQLEASEKKWKEWRKDILTYENEAHQWLNARIEFYSRRVNEYRKDWIEYWIKRYLMQQKQQIKSLSYYINIPQNLQFASNLCIDGDTATSGTAATTNSTTATSTSNGENKKNQVKSVGRETIEQFKKSTTSLVALTADVARDPRLEVIGRTIDVANKELLNNPKLIEEYHDKLLTEKKLLLEKYDIVDSLDIVPTNLIKPITNVGEDNLVNRQPEATIIGASDSKGYQDGRKDNEEIASVLIDEYVKAPFESKRIFIHGIPKDYQLMFNDKMKSLIFILDKCIQDKKDLYSTMEENKKKYCITNEP
ncbi:hypothetical protein PIROE2DRAFT_20403 [Piromyces sp. E2]|nr:hypothetical protein PIROE2DRAFT_20403 [Piromyces sp. E2]|eukprot:OUM65062.1 hypothetical protein PIROE2DRAFT_20403 [Piromyces sp. E2]